MRQTYSWPTQEKSFILGSRNSRHLGTHSGRWRGCVARPLGPGLAWWRRRDVGQSDVFTQPPLWRAPLVWTHVWQWGGGRNRCKLQGFFTMVAMACFQSTRQPNCKGVSYEGQPWLCLLDLSDLGLKLVYLCSAFIKSQPPNYRSGCLDDREVRAFGTVYPCSN